MRKHIISVFLALFFLLSSSFCLPKTDAHYSSTYDLKVVVTGITNSKGLVEFALYKNASVFTQAGKTHRLNREEAQKGTMSSSFKGLEPGKYALVVYHDENHNKICDKNFFGIPTEAYAFSNNVRPKLSVPSFEECAIRVQQDRSIEIKMVY
ncbi:MAG: hypothetical protein RLZZ211_303 [Bacteroidota bacterium]|jgi:uncharacterized protein (DUF2141 family)